MKCDGHMYRQPKYNSQSAGQVGSSFLRPEHPSLAALNNDARPSGDGWEHHHLPGWELPATWKQEATGNKGIATSNKGITTINKKLLVAMRYSSNLVGKTFAGWQCFKVLTGLGYSKQFLYKTKRSNLVCIHILCL